MTRFSRSLLGEQEARLRVSKSEHVLVRGSIRDGWVEEAGALTLQGAVAGTLSVQPGATASIQGAIAGRLEIAENAFALVQGVVVGEIVNRGRLVLDAQVLRGAHIESYGSGEVLSIDEVSSDLRAQLPRVDISYT